MQDMLSNLTLENWKDISVIFQAVLTVLLVVTAAFQLFWLREDNK